MAKKKETEVLEVGVDIQQALTDMTKMQRATTRNFQEVAKAVDKLNTTNKRASDDAVDGAEKWEAGIADLTKAYKTEGKEIENVLDNIELLHKKAGLASKEEKANIEEQIKGLKKIGAEKIKALKGRENKEGKAAADKMFKDSRGELKSALKDTISSVFSKDLKGVVENSAKTLVKGLKLSAASGLKMGHFGAGLADKGKSRGGGMGMAMRAGGMGMKGMGSLMGGIKPLIEGIAKIGPLLGAVSGAVLGLVKMFLDLDAKVKDFNKDILQSASNTEFLAQAGGNTDVAFGQMEDTLRGIRDAAYDLDNISWGISPDEFKGVLNVLNQEGVSLRSIGTEAARAGMTVKDFTSELAHVSVAYSRAFGVPLQEINQLQAEMMTELGTDLSQTKMAFQQMTRAADDSGISANKFFGMIRGVSQDLSLWGTRMEDAVKLLGRLGQVMNPRNAQKFMQSAVQGLKNMGRTERLRLTLLTGQGKMSKLIERDTKRKAEGLAKSFGMTGDELISKMNKEGPAGLEDAIQKLPKEMQGATREALIDMQLQQKRSGKGAFGTATAARNMGPTGALQAMSDALKRFVPGAKRLADVAGTIGGEMMAENLGVSEEQLDQMVKFEASLDNQREVLKKQLASGNADQMEAAKQALKQAGVEATTDEELRKKIDEAGYDQIMDTLSEGDKKALTEEAKVEDLAKKQADLQTSMLKKIEMILDFIMNQIYNIMVDIWDLIASIFGKKDERTLQKAVYQARDPALMKIFDDTRGDLNKFKEELIGKGGLGKGVSDRLDKFLNAKSPNERDNASLDARQVTESIDRGFKSQGSDAGDNVAQALKAAGIGGDQIEKVKDLMDKGSSFSKAMTDAGISEKDRVESLKKSLWFLDPSWLASLGSLRATPPEEGSKTDQAASAAKSAATGQPPTTPDVPKPPAQTPRPSETKTAATTPKEPQLPPPGDHKPVEPPSSKEAATAAQDNLSLTKEQLDTLHSVDNQMDKFKMDTGFLSGPYSKAVEGSVLAAVRTALFEYYMYKDLDQSSVVNAMAAGGMTARSFSQTMGTGAQSGNTGEMTLNTLNEHASGGLVTGVSGGLAMVTAAAGEGLASVGPGERIVPARGGSSGGNTYQINVQGVGGQELARIIEAKVIDGVHEYKRKERFT